MSVIRRLISAFGEKQFVYLLSTMRSGSTLCKSLLAVPPQTSHLPEVHFHKYSWLPNFRLKTLSEKPILILKKPSWVNEVGYPNIPATSNNRFIILIRHPYETILSIEKMQGQLREKDQLLWDRPALLNYWKKTYRQLKADVGLTPSLCIRYEDLTQNPISISKRMFQFIGLQHPGVEKYAPPESYQWSWKNDDGGEKIKSLTVSHSAPKREDVELMKLINEDEEVELLLKEYGY